MKPLEELRDKLKADIATLQAQLEGVEMSLRALNGEDASTLTARGKRTRAPRSNVKQYLLTLLDEVGADGLNASSAVERATAKGDQIERGTVSSLLSRLKNDGVVFYDGSVYRLTKHQGKAAADQRESVH